MSGATGYADLSDSLNMSHRGVHGCRAATPAERRRSCVIVGAVTLLLPGTQAQQGARGLPESETGVVARSGILQQAFWLESRREDVA